MAVAEYFEGYTEEQIRDARKFLDVFIKVPNEKKPIFVAMVSAFISGMETQEHLDGAVSSKA